MSTKLNNIYTQFSINDLENLSGIKAHTIRIWEKRYNLLEPARTDSNIRFYNISSLQKLLNVVTLYEAGQKISKIAKLKQDELNVAVRELGVGEGQSNYFHNSFILSMLNFDQSLFEETYNKLMSETSFKRLFVDYFIPLLHHVGLEWQSDKITPAHEHFVSCLIQQKLLVNIERMQRHTPSNDKTYVLFLPEQEIHELGLLFLHYDLVQRGKHSIYLGASVPMDNLLELKSLYDNVQFISYFTIQPELAEVDKYVETFDKTILDENTHLWLLGRNTQQLELDKNQKRIKIFEKIEDIGNIFS